MFDVRMPSLFLAIVVSAPALLAGSLAAQGDYSRAGYIALLEMVVISIAGALAAKRELD
jgi:hypothetical protein